jgi:hypothetical protein
MAVKVITQTLCDKCGSQTENPALALGYQGRSYEMDLCDKCSAALDKLLVPFVGIARRLSRVAAARSKKAAARPDSQVVRAWAQENGVEIPSRGRVPESVVAQYRAETGL